MSGSPSSPSASGPGDHPRGTPGEADPAALLERVATGDQDALVALHRRYVRLVYSLALRVLAEDDEAARCLAGRARSGRPRPSVL